MKKPKTKNKPKKYPRCGKILDTVAYTYLQKASLAYAKTKGVKEHGTVSAYLNALVCKDRGVKAPEGLKHQEKKSVTDMGKLRAKASKSSTKRGTKSSKKKSAKTSTRTGNSVKRVRATTSRKASSTPSKETTTHKVSEAASTVVKTGTESSGINAEMAV